MLEQLRSAIRADSRSIREIADTAKVSTPTIHHLLDGQAVNLKLVVHLIRHYRLDANDVLGLPVGFEYLRGYRAAMAKAGEAVDELRKDIFEAEAIMVR